MVGSDTPVRPWLSQAEHYENFPVASRLVPARLRAPMAAVYKFARYADDVADEGNAGPAARLAELNHLRQAVRGQAEHPMVADLAQVVAVHNVDPALFEALLSAFEQDAQGTTYSTADQLLNYCERSANPVGRIVLRIFDADHNASLPASDSICTALQLANFAQDIGQDISRGRCYIPADELRGYHLSQADLIECANNRQITPAVRQLLNNQIDRALSTLQAGAPLLRQVRGRLGLELAAIVAGGRTILERTRHEDPFANRLKLGKADFPMVAWRSLSLHLGFSLK